MSNSLNDGNQNETLHISFHKRLLEVLLKALGESIAEYDKRSDVEDRLFHLMARIEESSDEFIEALQIAPSPAPVKPPIRYVVKPKTAKSNAD